MVKKILISEDNDGQRLDRWLKKTYKMLPYTLLQKLLRTGQVRIDGKRAKPGAILKKGQEVRLPPLEEKDPTIPRKPKEKDIENFRKTIIYEDDQILVINKPQGIAVQGGTKLTFHLDQILKAYQENDVPLRLTHRLDKDTSGVLVLAKTLKAAIWVTQAFKERKVKKVYWAFTVGTPQRHTGTVSSKIIKNRGVLSSSSTEGKQALTHYRVVSHVGSKFSWLELIPETGRTHQLRIHCFELGIPILGDDKYGEKNTPDFMEKKPKLHLHARSIELTYPNSQKKTFVAPLSPVMKKTWDYFGFEEK